ncbi:hypothetical protein NADFUDRAFT_45402 [Nadsonia fulvescens var. elongata DSM 6958]|uniref:Sulfhydryl oxidase n=1 Tax=Nadsonia fulvescens var. elongata DSM 6958 TaxID=857566 RepID=A0A1E3PQP1_9ASCO|nr:hypothetical protein NADFUDRAFT_45402 [Nadsonia fulvescens var. elongata DSM 6958]
MRRNQFYLISTLVFAGILFLILLPASRSNIAGTVGSPTLADTFGKASGSSEQTPAPPREKVNVDSNTKNNQVESSIELERSVGSISDSESGTLGKPIMGKLTNETAKAELGRASWKLFHTILARYPETPTTQEQGTLSSYIHLFSQVYPCGQCAEHFQFLLEEFPPQTGSRKTAAMWGCHVHNQVNKRLGKAIYDCGNILKEYDCGCGDKPLADSSNAKAENKASKSNTSNSHLQNLQIELPEGYTRGG